MSSSKLGKRKRDGHVFSGPNFVSGSSQLNQGDVYYITNESPQDEELKCVQSFYTGKSYQRYKDINPPRAANTCLWVLEHPQFIGWRDDAAEALLWISADPGCGKSVLSRSLIDNDLCSDGSTICFFFFKDNDDQNNLREALCALLHQLLTRKPNLIGHAMPAYQQYGTDVQQEVDSMWSILLSAISDVDAGPVTIVLDALDECRDADRRDLITRLCGFRELATSGPANIKAKFLVTSRPYDNVQRWFHDTMSNFPQIRLRGEDENEQINKEIDIVIGLQVSKLGREFDLSNTHQQSLKNRLISMQHRTYLWLHLAMEELREAYKLSFIPDEVEIKSLSRDINEAYETILRKISNEGQRKNARIVLAIILGARRPLSLCGMASALSAHTAHENSITKLPEVQVSRLQKLIREWCGLFVFVKNDKLFLIHQTAREFLLSRTGDYTSANASGWQNSFYAPSLDHTMAYICIKYLHLIPRTWVFKFLRNLESQWVGPGLDNSAPFTDHLQHEHGLMDTDSSTDDENRGLNLLFYHPDGWDFLEYCLHEWSSHMNDHDLDTDRELLQWFLDLCDPSRGSVFVLYLCHYSQKYYEEIPKRRYGDKLFLRFAQAGRFKLLRALKSTFQCGVNDTNKDRRHALSLAASKGCVETVQWLLGQDALIDAVDCNGFSALMHAASLGHQSVAQLLLQNGACIKTPDANGSTALDWAVRGGHAQIVRLILQKDAKWAVSDLTSRFLRFAISMGYADVLETLLQYGTAMNFADETGASALRLAISEGHIDVLEVLFQHGALINFGDEPGASALCMAIPNGGPKYVQWLLRKGARIEATNHLGQTPLLIATQSYKLDIVKLLLTDAGANINAQDKNGDTSLHMAVKRTFYEAVKELVKAGADTEILDKNGKTPLQRALRLELIYRKTSAWEGLPGLNRHGFRDGVHIRDSAAKIVHLLSQNDVKYPSQ